MTIFGVMRPKLIAKVMITAVMPLAIFALIRCGSQQFHPAGFAR